MNPAIRGAGEIDFTLLVCTFDRSNDLRELLASAIAQETDGLFTFEILVVDNNSSDDTRHVVEEFVGRGVGNVRYLFEGRQGKSYALNSGIAAGRASIFTIIDDDQILPPTWLRTVFEAFRAHPEIAFIGGKVLPLWLGDVPAWVNAGDSSALGLADYGDHPFFVDRRRQVCLLACSFRRPAIESVNGFRSELGVSRTLIGSVEDFDILQRLARSGHRGLYFPTLTLYHKVRPQRLTKRYHRRWHTEHGRFYAKLRDPEFEASRVRVLGVPGHVYRQVVVDALQWLGRVARGRFAQAFTSEVSLRFCLGFVFERSVGRRTLRGAAKTHGLPTADAPANAAASPSVPDEILAVNRPPRAAPRR